MGGRCRSAGASGGWRGQGCRHTRCGGWWRRPRCDNDACAGAAGAVDYTLFRSGIELVTLHVTVIDKSQPYVTDLTPADFTVFENGRRQEVAFFQRSGLPLALALLFDTSGSMRGALPALQRAGAEFVRSLGPEDAASVMSFGDTVRILQDVTADRSALERAICLAPPEGGTAFNTVVYVALTHLSASAASLSDGVPRRRVLVLLSLRTLFADIRGELASHYALAYEPGGARNGDAFRSLSVLVAAPNAVARTRGGYLAGAR